MNTMSSQDQSGLFALVFGLVAIALLFAIPIFWLFVLATLLVNIASKERRAMYREEIKGCVLFFIFLTICGIVSFFVPDSEES